LKFDQKSDTLKLFRVRTPASVAPTSCQPTKYFGSNLSNCVRNLTYFCSWSNLINNVVCQCCNIHG